MTELDRVDKTVDNMIKITKRSLNYYTKKNNSNKLIDINSRLSTLYEFKQIINDVRSNK